MCSADSVRAKETKVRLPFRGRDRLLALLVVEHPAVVHLLIEGAAAHRVSAGQQSCLRHVRKRQSHRREELDLGCVSGGDRVPPVDLCPQRVKGAQQAAQVMARR